MKKEQLRNLRSHRLRVVKDRMTNLTAQREEAYAENREEIEGLIQKIVNSICTVHPLNPEAFKLVITNVLHSFRYGSRPSESIKDLLLLLLSHPPEVIYNAITSYQAFLMKNTKTRRKKHSINYFLGFIRNDLFDYEKKTYSVATKDKTKDLPDDL